MTKEQLEFFSIISDLRKLNVSSMLPEIAMGEFDVLKKIAACRDESGSARISCVVRSMCMPPPAISRTMRSLETKGLIERNVDRNDRRSTLVELTPSGEALIGEVDRIMGEFADAVFCNVGEENMQKLNCYLRQFVDTARAEVARRKYSNEEKTDKRSKGV
ncbi:MAG: MarR family winged helix-turn-helix transcriptional regulator [Emergencia sp.]